MFHWTLGLGSRPSSAKSNLSTNMGSNTHHHYKDCGEQRYYNNLQVRLAVGLVDQGIHFLASFVIPHRIPSAFSSKH